MTTRSILENNMQALAEAKDANANDIVSRLRRIRDMIALHEKIAWGDDVEVMGDAADEIERLRSLLDDQKRQAEIDLHDRNFPTY